MTIGIHQLSIPAHSQGRQVKDTLQAQIPGIDNRPGEIQHILCPQCSVTTAADFRLTHGIQPQGAALQIDASCVISGMRHNRITTNLNEISRRLAPQIQLTTQHDHGAIPQSERVTNSEAPG